MATFSVDDIVVLREDDVEAKLKRGVQVFIVSVSETGRYNVSRSKVGKAVLLQAKLPNNFASSSDENNFAVSKRKKAGKKQVGVENFGKLVPRKEVDNPPPAPKHWFELDQPFPMTDPNHNLLDNDCYFTASSLREIPTRVGERFERVTWNSKTYTGRQFTTLINKWKAAFPVYTEKKRAKGMES